MDKNCRIKFGGSFNYLSDIHKINWLQRAILVNSYLYYELDNPVVTDKKFDEICKQYLEMVNGMVPDRIAIGTEYGYVFFDFDGSTGFYLWDRLIESDKNKISRIAKVVLKESKRNGN